MDKLKEYTDSFYDVEITFHNGYESQSDRFEQAVYTKITNDKFKGPKFIRDENVVENILDYIANKYNVQRCTYLDVRLTLRTNDGRLKTHQD